MDNEEKVLNAFKKIFTDNKNNDDIIEVMEEVKPELLGMEDEVFSETMYNLQKEGKIRNIKFEDNDPKKITMWEDIEINLPELKVYYHN